VFEEVSDILEFETMPVVYIVFFDVIICCGGFNCDLKELTVWSTFAGAQWSFSAYFVAFYLPKPKKFLSLDILSFFPGCSSVVI